MFGTEMRPHDDRYDMAEEWLAVVKRLWTEDEEFDHDGKYYQIKKGYLQPKPIQRPFPAVMNAGGSERGRHFAAKNCDLVYTVLTSEDIDDCRRACAVLSRTGAQGIRPRDRGVEPRLYRAGRDREGGARLPQLVHLREGRLGGGRQRHHHHGAQRQEHSARAHGAHEGALHRRLERLSADRHQGADRRWACRRWPRPASTACCLSWPRFIEGMREFRDVTYPLLKQSGLRDFGR